MPLKGIQPRDFNEAHLQSLMAGQVPEGKTVDYKQELPPSSDGAKKDFLADLCSFANAAGGYMIFGISESEGVPVDLPGVDGDIDAAILRMESMARDGIRPPIPSLQFVRVALANGKNAIIVAIPKSWNPPHQVVFQKDYRFYTRGSAGKQHVDVDELRRIVLLSQEAGERIRQFRAGRVAAVMSDDTPVPLQPGARQMLHLVPLNAFATGAMIDLAPLESNRGLLVGVMEGGGSQRYNVDGLLAYSQSGEAYDAYAQIFRNGILESVFHREEYIPKAAIVLPSLDFEQRIFEQVKSALATLKALSVLPPVVMMLSFTGVQGWEMGVRDDYGMRRRPGGFDRDPLLIPELLLETFEIADLPKAVKPIIDSTWNAAGFPRSDYYDPDGKWVGEHRR